MTVMPKANSTSYLFCSCHYPLVLPTSLLASEKLNLSRLSSADQQTPYFRLTGEAVKRKKYRKTFLIQTSTMLSLQKLTLLSFLSLASCSPAKRQDQYASLEVQDNLMPYYPYVCSNDASIPASHALYRSSTSLPTTL